MSNQISNCTPSNGKALCRTLDRLPAPVVLIDASFKLISHNLAARELDQRGVGPSDGEAGDETLTCFTFLKGLQKPCRVPLIDCPVRAWRETGEPLTMSNACGSQRPVSSFEADSGLVGLLFDTCPAPEREERRLIRTGKLAALGAMLSHIVHNLNSTFYVTANYLGVLDKKLEGREERAELSHILEALSKTNKMATDMAKTLLDYTRQQDSRQLIYAGEGVREVINLLSSALAAAGIEPQISGEHEGPQLARQPLLTVLFNVIQNAIEAMPQGGDLQVEISADKVTISDQGRGISPENLERIFTPYFTTSETGTGLGLYIARRIMRNLNGTIKAISHPGAGTTIELIFHGHDQ